MAADGEQDGDVNHGFGLPALSRVADQCGHDGLRVGDDGEVGALDHFGVKIGVDGNDVLYLRDALQVLGRSRDPQREVTPRGHQSARSADLAVARQVAGIADHAAAAARRPQCRRPVRRNPPSR